MGYANKEDERAYQAKWRSENRDKKRAHERKWRLANPEKHKAQKERSRAKHRDKMLIAQRSYIFKRAYGLTVEQRDEMLAAQGGVCAANGCTEPASSKGWHTDHCHATGTVRGILCRRCNIALGHMCDDPIKLRALADYIERHAKHHI